MWILMLYILGAQPQTMQYVTPFKTLEACTKQLAESDAKFNELYPGVPHQMKCLPGKKK